MIPVSNMRALSLTGFWLAAALGGAATWAAAAPAAQLAAAPSAFVTLDGKPAVAGNPIGADGHIHQVNKPVLRLFRTEVAAPKGTILLFPGGGYSVLAVGHEGVATAAALNADGYDVAMLADTVVAGPTTRARALGDALAAWRLLKSSRSALGRHAGRMGVMGYSAGGHLPARLFANLQPNEQADDVMLIYPAYLEQPVPGTRVPAFQPPVNPAGRLFALIAANDNARFLPPSRIRLRHLGRRPAPAAAAAHQSRRQLAHSFNDQGCLVPVFPGGARDVRPA